jgi:hypothetical protein
MGAAADSEVVVRRSTENAEGRMMNAECRKRTSSKAEKLKS